VALLLSLRYLARNDRHADAGRLDAVGLALLSPGLAVAVYGLSEAGGGSGFGNTKVLLCLGIGLALIVAFVLHALRVDRPLLDMRLFKDRGFSMANVATFVFGAVLYAAMFLLPLYYQLLRGESAVTAGLLMAPQGIGAMLSMPSGGRLTDKLGAARIVPIGMAVFLIGTLGYTQVGPASSYGWLAFVLFVRGVGMGWVMMPTMSAAYANLTRDMVPRATTILNILMRVGGSFGTAVIAVILQRQISHRLPQQAAILSTGRPTGRFTHSQATKLADSFGYAFWVVVVITAVGLAASLLLPKGRPGAALSMPGTRRDETPVTVPD
jgi:EmrB/QacA subfamily drug resistance transporter